MYKTLSEYIKHIVLNDNIVKGLFRDGVKVAYSSNNIIILSDIQEKNKVAVWKYYRGNKDRTREIDYTWEIVNAKMSISEILDYIRTIRGDNETVKATRYNYKKQVIRKIRSRKNCKYILKV